MARGVYNDIDDDDESYSEGSEILGASDIDEETVDLESHMGGDHSTSHASESGSEDDDDDDNNIKTNSAHSSSKGQANRHVIRDRQQRRGTPARTKSDDIGGGGSRHRPQNNNTKASRRIPPPRSKSFDRDTTAAAPRRSELGYGTKQGSQRSLGGPRMRREGSQKQLIDKGERESNRARRLRAVGQGPKNARCQLLRRSQSFSNRTSGSKLTLDSDHSKEGEENNDNEKSNHGQRKQLPSRSNSGITITEEERQYARTAARGITRSRSLRGAKLNIDDTTRSVASKLQGLGVRSEHTPRSSTAHGSSSSSSSRREARKKEEEKRKKQNNEAEQTGEQITESKSADSESPDSPKAVTTGLSW